MFPLFFVQRHRLLCRCEARCKSRPFRGTKKRASDCRSSLARDDGNLLPKYRVALFAPDIFERLYQFKVQHGIPTWEQALEKILPALEEA